MYEETICGFLRHCGFCGDARSFGPGTRGLHERNGVRDGHWGKPARFSAQRNASAGQPVLARHSVPNAHGLELHWQPSRHQIAMGIAYAACQCPGAFAASGPFNCRIFFIGPGWNAPLSNTNPKPVSPTIVANGEDDYKVLSLTTPAYAVGFVLLTNYAANETVTLTFFDGNSAVIVDSMLGTSQNSFEFVGFRSLKSITSVAINTTGGTSQNEGIVAIWLATFYQVQIDIKPGSFPNSINLGSNGTVPVAILSSAGFDARTVDPLTVQLAGASVPLRGKGTPMASFQDVNGDGLLDLVVHVSTEALTLGIGDTLAVLTATTFGGLPIRGTDTVRIVPPGS